MQKNKFNKELKDLVDDNFIIFIQFLIKNKFKLLFFIFLGIVIGIFSYILSNHFIFKFLYNPQYNIVNYVIWLLTDKFSSAIKYIFVGAMYGILTGLIVSTIINTFKKL